MSMPFRQKMACFIAPCGVKEFKQVVEADGTVKNIVDDIVLPPSEKFSTANMAKAGVPMEEVSSYFTVLTETKQEPDIQGDD